MHPSLQYQLIVHNFFHFTESDTKSKTRYIVNARTVEPKPVRMLVRDENGNFEAKSKLTFNEEFKKAHRCPLMDTNNNTDNDTNNNNAQLVNGADDVSIDRSSIKSFYRNACILVTGGTGFVGKVLLEKLLRTCDNLQCIYVLLRSKRGLTSEERYHELIQNPVFFSFFNWPNNSLKHGADFFSFVVFIGF